MNLEVITSFNQRYYDLIGHASVATWLELWPKELSLTCYTEEMSLSGDDRIIQIGYDQLPPGYYRFQNSELKSRNKVFAKKAYCVIHALLHSKADWVLWLDADVLTTKAIDLQLLKSLMPNDVLSMFLGVNYTSTKDGKLGNWLVPETGIFSVNRKHPKFDTFLAEYKRRYDSMDSEGLRRFYDNDVFGVAIQKAAASCNDLCAGLGKPYSTPLKHTVLGPYLHHYKAKHSKNDFQDATQ